MKRMTLKVGKRRHKTQQISKEHGGRVTNDFVAAPARSRSLRSCRFCLRQYLRRLARRPAPCSARAWWHALCTHASWQPHGQHCVNDRSRRRKCCGGHGASSTVLAFTDGGCLRSHAVYCAWWTVLAPQPFESGRPGSTRAHTPRIPASDSGLRGSRRTQNNPSPGPAIRLSQLRRAPVALADFGSRAWLSGLQRRPPAASCDCQDCQRGAVAAHAQASHEPALLSTVRTVQWQAGEPLVGACGPCEEPRLCPPRAGGADQRRACSLPLAAAAAPCCRRATGGCAGQRAEDLETGGRGRRRWGEMVEAAERERIPWRVGSRNMMRVETKLFQDLRGRNHQKRMFSSLFFSQAHWHCASIPRSAPPNIRPRS